MNTLIFFSHTVNEKSYNYVWPHSLFTKELLNAMTSSIKNFIPYDWQILVKLSLNQENIFSGQCGFMI